MRLSRRQFIHTAATATAAAWPLTVRAQQAAAPRQGGLFRHGVASGDPLTDRVMLWTRVTPPDANALTPIDVRWVIAADERLTQVVSRGTAQAPAERDFTVKVDAGDLRPGRTYFYAFDTGGEQSPIGRTKTLPDEGASRVRIAQVSCSNYPTGYFNVYRCLANRPDLDVVLHLGDYIYEFAQGRYSDPSLKRTVLPAGETTTLQDYRTRYALYRADVDLQDVHRLHPFIVVWDDHELANNAWARGAGNHRPAQGDWKTRQEAAYRAYLEWMPIRESRTSGIRLFRSFRFGRLVDLLMLDTRGLRDEQVDVKNAAVLSDARRTLLGAEQESWLFDALRGSQRSGSRWRLLGQQVLFAPMTPPGTPVQNTDVWDGYPAARERVFDMLASERVADVAILTGDIHSSWALDVPRTPWSGYNPGTGAGSRAVEIVTPAVSSPPMFSSAPLRDAAKLLLAAAGHVKFLDGDSRGYVLLDIGPDRMLADWYFVPTVTERTDRESRAAGFVCERGSSRLVRQ
ncbi:MAG TPA: alkaline phosphatase D family protein [Vicinamibacterales bacterium]|nr:alkaline phosphatase D family protein [Vicinamibacterales bacterium]